MLEKALDLEFLLDQHGMIQAGEIITQHLNMVYGAVAQVIFILDQIQVVVLTQELVEILVFIKVIAAIQTQILYVHITMRLGG